MRISENETGKCTGLAPGRAAAPRPKPTQRIHENAFNIHAVDFADPQELELEMEFTRELLFQSDMQMQHCGMQ